MKYSDIKKTARENTPAIVTSIIIFLLVSMYMIWIVPANEHKYDNYNRSTLEEFNLQFNNTLKDFATQVDTTDLKNFILKKARVLCESCQKSKSDPELIPYLDSIHKNRILHDIKNKVIIQSVSIDSISDKGSEIFIYKRINLKLDDASAESYKGSKTFHELCCLTDTSRVDKRTLKERLNGAIAFKNWVIYSASDRKIIIDQGIEKEEFDSIKTTASKSGVLLFKFSDKRFYRQSVTIEGTNNSFMLVGAISQTNFALQSKRIDLDLTFISAFCVILLLLSIPLIKPLISSKMERLTQLDMLNTTAALGILAIVLVSFTFSQFLSKSYQNITAMDLHNQNNLVAKKLNEEFNPYYDAFNLDTVQRTLDPKVKNPIHYNLAQYKDSVLDDLSKKDAFQNFFTFDKDGDLVKDISREGIFTIRRNFRERDYFQTLQKKRYSGLLTSVFSRYDNKFKFVYVQKNPLTEIKRKEAQTVKYEEPDTTSKIDTVSYTMTGFAFSPKFIETFKSNVYNGYLLCNNTGRVILNSDLSKSLHEDIYANSQHNYALSQMLHGINNSDFTLNYNGEPCVFYAKKYPGKMLAAGKDTTYLLDENPLYLITYRKLGFTNNLQLYTIINGFILSLAYVLGITLLVLLYSVFFFLGDISVLSRLHLHWMFPDNSRKNEYNLLKVINYLMVALFMTLFIAGYKHVLYLALLSGINLAFFNFVLLNQRLFLVNMRILSFKKEKRDHTIAKSAKYLISWLLMLALFGYFIPYALYTKNLASFGLILSLISHFIILYFLRKDKDKNALPKDQKICNESIRPAFVSYFLSILSYHYILVPLLIIFSIFISEINIVKDLDNSYVQSEQRIGGSQQRKSEGILKTDGKVISALPVEPPSKKYLEDTRFDNYNSISEDYDFMRFIKESVNINFIFLLVAVLVVIFIAIRKLVNYYSGRFFFFELSEAYRLGYFNPNAEAKAFTNTALMIPPYSEKDLQYLEIMEKHNDEIPDLLKLMEEGKLDSRIWLKGVSGEIVSNQVKMEMIMMNHFETYRNHYKELWNILSEEEKFVMSDFAVDYFINYKNRNVMIQLMKKGYIIADPLTGRLRIMNYGFRNFIVYLNENAPESAKALQKEEEQAEGTYSKWKLPLMIIAISGIIMFMYVNKESFNHVLFVGGSAISAIGLIAKFLNVYKQN